MDSTDTATIAAIAAGGAVLGALVGATAGGVVDYVLDRGRTKRRAFVGARLVASDISMGASRIEAAEVEKKWWAFYELPMNAWPEYRDVLAERLTVKEDWEIVSQVATTMPMLGEKMGESPSAAKGGPYFRLSDSSAAKMRPLRKEATQAYNALARIGDLDEVDGLLHEGTTRP
jgi:hypothetical protein